MKATVILITIGDFRTVPKNLGKKLGEQISKNIQTTVLLKLARILRRVLLILADLLLLRLQLNNLPFRACVKDSI